MNERKKAALHNLGCKVNAYETEAMQQLLKEAGYEIVPFEPGADVYVINTCTVTNIADRKSRQMLHKARKMNPNAIVVAAGCYVQTLEKEDENTQMIDIVLGNNRKGELLEALQVFEEARSREIIPEEFDKRELITEEPKTEEPKTEESENKDGLYRKIDINRTREYEGLSIWAQKRKDFRQDSSGEEKSETNSFGLKTVEEHTRASVKVQDGCNQFCTYCIIPYARGRVRSRNMEDAKKEIRQLAENGCKEVVLTGIHLSSYGVDLGTDLLELIQAVHAIPGIERIRLGSLEPGIITEDFAEALSRLPKLCPHFHLSLQSGCTSVLKRMNRRYTAEEFEARCKLLRQHFLHPAITTDVIVGFPGETEDEFLQTVSYLERIQLYETHIFKYSRRKGTRAAAMPMQVPEPEKGRRSNVLISLGEKNRTLFEERMKGEAVEVLFEEKIRIEEKEYYVGYTKEYIKTAIVADKNYRNQIVRGTLGEEVAPHIFLLSK